MTWTNPDPPGGKITEYNITIVPDGETTGTTKIVQPDAKQPITITDLTAFKKYTATISITNAKNEQNHGGGKGNDVKFPNFQMLPDGKCITLFIKLLILISILVGQPVTGLTVTATEQKTLTINWVAPADKRGEIDHYEIQLTAEGETPALLTAQPKEQQKLATNLAAFKDYTVQVVTVNQKLNEKGGGPGEPVVTPTPIKTWPARKLTPVLNAIFSQRRR